MRPNRAMTELLASPPGAVIVVPSPFRALVSAGFRDVDGCVFLRELFSHDELGAMHIHTDRTGYEAAVNKIHLEDYREPGMTRETAFLAHTASRCAEFLAVQLRQHSSDSFVIISSVEDRYCSFRFHKVRNGERWMNDVDTYSEALFALDVQSGN